MQNETACAEPCREPSSLSSRHEVSPETGLPTQGQRPECGKSDCASGADRRAAAPIPSILLRAGLNGWRRANIGKDGQARATPVPRASYSQQDLGATNVCYPRTRRAELGSIAYHTLPIRGPVRNASDVTCCKKWWARLGLNQ